MDSFLRINQVMEITALKKSTIWWLVSKKEFPKQIKISERISVWKKSDIEVWMKSKIDTEKQIADI